MHTEAASWCNGLSAEDWSGEVCRALSHLIENNAPQRVLANGVSNVARFCLARTEEDQGQSLEARWEQSASNLRAPPLVSRVNLYLVDYL